MTKIYIDPGHGGKDSGAVSNGLREKDLTLKIARYTRDYLLNNYQGVSVRMSRSSDKYLTLAQRTTDANNWKADILVSIHINAASSSSATGYEDFIWNGTVSQNTKNLQNSIHNEVTKALKGFKNRGKKRANFHMLRVSKMPAVLSEFLFITNKQDASFLKKDSNLKLIAKHLAIGIAKHQKLKEKPKPKPKKSTTLYKVQIGAYSVKRNAVNQVKLAKQRGFKDAFATKVGNLYRVQLGAYSVKSNADRQLKKAKSAGFKDAFITTK